MWSTIVYYQIVLSREWRLWAKERRGSTVAAAQQEYYTQTTAEHGVSLTPATLVRYPIMAVDDEIPFHPHYPIPRVVSHK